MAMHCVFLGVMRGVFFVEGPNDEFTVELQHLRNFFSGTPASSAREPVYRYRMAGWPDPHTTTSALEDSSLQY